MFNPFPVSHYISPEYFCNRRKELALLQNNIENGIQTTLFAPRRLGKTGLIQHLFYILEEENKVKYLYLDILSTQNQTHFTEYLSKEILKNFPVQKTIGKKFMEVMTSFRPVVSYDSLSGTPEISLDFANEKQKEKSLADIFLFLDSLQTTIVVAIDEFQQVLSYPEKNTEASLRTIMQQLKNIRFIFCGSNQTMMNEIFNSAKRPFFASCHNMHLDKIAQEDYKPFIESHFNSNKREISDESIGFILDWTSTHTYYTQYLCNQVFGSNIKKIQLINVQQVCLEVLKANEPVYFQYRNLLTVAQWNLLTAIAKETELYQPYASEFIFKYKLGSSAQVKRSLEALLEKEMIYQENAIETPYYTVYDKFLMRWLQRLK